jgi:hypothetical protein
MVQIFHNLSPQFYFFIQDKTGRKLRFMIKQLPCDQVVHPITIAPGVLPPQTTRIK